MSDDPTTRLQAMRQAYSAAGLDESDLAPGWLEQFLTWLAAAEDAGVREPNAMVFATATSDAAPNARTVLLKGVDPRGFVLYTNLRSAKGREVLANPRGALVFPWDDLQRQVVVRGVVEQLTGGESDAYFATRPREAQLGAVASPQSEVVADRAALDRALREAAAAFPEGEPVRRPDHWGGLRVVPETVEFWQGRAGRLHDRLRYRRRAADDWTVERLAP